MSAKTPKQQYIRSQPYARNSSVEEFCLDRAIFLPFFTGLSVSYTNIGAFSRIDIVRGTDKFSPVLHKPITQLTTGYGNM